ncbi:adenylate/guanylate cyclase domain-containing protein [Rhodobacteraceae bacterium M382]|nr:adenylate/guanylate cyclase domain-containing protein [Rhodobacteraceae bacterium M382]
MDEDHQERKLTTILSADVVGYAQLMSKDESGTLTRLKELRRSLIDPRIKAHHGRTIKLMGDGSLVEFASVVDAVSFAVDVQIALAASQENEPEHERLRFRVGINVGDVMVDGDDIYGDGVNVAARIEGLAEPGGICVSQTVFDHVTGKLDLGFEPMGAQQLKNIPVPVDVFKVELDERSQSLATDTAASATPPSRKPRLERMTIWTLLAGAIVIGLVVLALQFRSSDATPPVIAVLPFEDFSAPPHQGYLSDAVSGNIITSLARYPQLSVISQRSSFQFRDSGLGISEIADKLGADFILEGSQQYDGTRLRTTAQLIDGSTEAHIWADEFDVPLDALLKTNSLISRKIANAVGARVVDLAEARMTAGDVSALMIANAAQSRIVRNFNRENLLINIEEQEQSLKDYPDSAWGYLGQALSLRIGLRFGWIEGDEEATRKRMYDLARRGVEIDPNNFMAYHALGRALMFNRDVEAAAVAFRRAVELNPSAFFSRNALAQALNYVGETEEALAVIAESERIDPLYGHDVQWEKSKIQWQMENCDQALATFQSAPTMPVAANKTLAAIHHCLGNQDKAVQSMADFVAENPNWTVSRERGIITGMWTAPGAADRWLEAMEAAGMPL